VCGELRLDEGASRVLKQAGKSLLPVGVTHISGRFKRGELVSIQDQTGKEIGRGLVNYSAEDALKVIGKSSEQIIEVLGFSDGDALVHRDNLILV